MPCYADTADILQVVISLYLPETFKASHVCERPEPSYMRLAMLEHQLRTEGFLREPPGWYIKPTFCYFLICIYLNVRCSIWYPVAEI